jgi:hypothetical protein
VPRPQICGNYLPNCKLIALPGPNPSLD